MRGFFDDFIFTNNGVMYNTSIIQNSKAISNPGIIYNCEGKISGTVSGNTPQDCPDLPDEDLEQHNTLEIVDGFQTYQNTKYGFTIKYPSSFSMTTGDKLASGIIGPDKLKVTPIVLFEAYPVRSVVKIEYIQDGVNSIVDDDAYMKELEKYIQNIDHTVLLSGGAKQSKNNLILSDVTEVDGHRAYKVMTATLIYPNPSENIELSKITSKTNVIYEENIFSIFTMSYERSSLSSVLPILPDMFSSTTIKESADSFEFVNEQNPFVYVDSEIGLKLQIPDSWTIRDNTSFSYLPRLLAADQEDNDDNIRQQIPEYFFNVNSQVEIFPKNEFIGDIEFPAKKLTVIIGDKSDMFDDKTPLEFLIEINAKEHEITSDLALDYVCSWSTPKLEKINNMQAYGTILICNNQEDDVDESQDSFKSVKYLVMTDDYFVLLNYNGSEKTKHEEIVNLILQSLEIKKSVSLAADLDLSASAIEDSNGRNSDDDEIMYEPEPIPEPEPVQKCGTGTELVNGVCQMIKTDDDDSEKIDGSGGCLIATATYGTELAPQVQFLREIRDNTVMSTASGSAFMAGFNTLYY